MSGWLCSAYGWPSVFYVSAVSGALWVVAWALFGASSPATCRCVRLVCLCACVRVRLRACVPTCLPAWRFVGGLFNTPPMLIPRSPTRSGLVAVGGSVRGRRGAVPPVRPCVSLFRGPPRCDQPAACVHRWISAAEREHIEFTLAAEPVGTSPYVPTDNRTLLCTSHPPPPFPACLRAAASERCPRPSTFSDVYVDRAVASAVVPVGEQGLTPRPVVRMATAACSWACTV